MEINTQDIEAVHALPLREAYAANFLNVPFRQDLAFPTLTESMLERLKNYGSETIVPAETTLYTEGSHRVEMFVVFEGVVRMWVPTPAGGRKTFAEIEAGSFTGEMTLLNSQRSLVEAKTATECRLLHISRSDFQHLMRAEGDIANIIVSAAIWRRIGILRTEETGVIITGLVEDAELTTLQRFFVRNNYPHSILALTREEMAQQGQAERNLPCVRLLDGRVLTRPTIPALADELGITQSPPADMVFDVAVVGAGPGGLAAAVYAASEGLCTIIIEGFAPGGQAGTSSKIENYLGFPTGIGGQHLASRAELQALKFGAHFSISREVISIEQDGGLHKLILAGGSSVRARAVVVASGARYRQPTVPNYQRFENRGLFYAATAMESILCRDSDVIVIGGGNSAGQAAMFLSGIARHVYLLVRGESLASTMSHYLIARIENSPRISVCTHCEITALTGEHGLESVTWVDRNTGELTTKPVRNVFVMIGAEPNTGWLYGTVRLDTKGFILTGGSDAFDGTPYGTNVSGIYAIGDARSRSVKRVASAVGEGSVVISDVHQYLAAHPDKLAAHPSSTLAALQAVPPVAVAANSSSSPAA